MTEAAKAAMRAYKKEWRAKNRDKVREQNEKYWERRAQRELEATKNASGGETCAECN